jgi:hypothetical protein
MQLRLSERKLARFVGMLSCFASGYWYGCGKLAAGSELCLNYLEGLIVEASVGLAF